MPVDTAGLLAWTTGQPQRGRSILRWAVFVPLLLIAKGCTGSCPVYQSKELWRNELGIIKLEELAVGCLGH